MDFTTPTFEPSTSSTPHRAPSVFRRRAALGLGPQTTPSLLFVLAGFVLGPSVIGLISLNVLAQLDPVISIVLAVLGIFIGAGSCSALQDSDRGPEILLGASVQALITLSTVIAAMYFLLSRWDVPASVKPLPAALLLGICSAVSAAVHVETVAGRETILAAHLADLDDLAVLIVSVFLVPVIAGFGSPSYTVVLALAAGLCVAIAGALLFAHSHGAPERGVFVLGTVMLLGGTGAYSNVSPLAVGCVAGLLWTWMRKAPHSLVESELRRLQHPLVALLLIIAGASIEFSYPLLWIAGPLVLFRTTGKLLGSLVLASWLRLSPGLLAKILVPPGVLGIALALGIQQVLGTGDNLLVSAITIATVVSELLGLVVSDTEALT